MIDTKSFRYKKYKKIYDSVLFDKSSKANENIVNWYKQQRMSNTLNPLKDNDIESTWLAVGYVYYDYLAIHIIDSCS
mgnify:CR=1 FL=1|jgi:hypothetical protein